MIFKGSKFSQGTSDLSVFKFLWEKNKNNFIGEEFIFDKDNKLLKTKALEVDISFWKSIKRREKVSEISFQSIPEILKDFLDNNFYKTGLFAEKMKMYCEFCDTYGDNPGLMKALGAKILDQKFRMYYEYYGTQGCRAVSYKEADLYRGWKDTTKETDLRNSILEKFKIGDRYPVSEVKEILSEIHEDLNITRKAKATDLGKYFKLTKTRITLPDKTVVNGFRLDPL